MNVSINSAFEIALQTAASLYEGTLAKLLLLLVLGVLCFAGGWIVRWVSALYGAVTGVCLGICLTGVLGSLGVANGGDAGAGHCARHNRVPCDTPWRILGVRHARRADWICAGRVCGTGR